MSHRNFSRKPQPELLRAGSFIFLYRNKKKCPQIKQKPAGIEVIEARSQPTTKAG